MAIALYNSPADVAFILRSSMRKGQAEIRLDKVREVIPVGEEDKKTYSFASGSLYGGGGRGRRGWEETPILFQRGSRSTRSFLGGGAVVFIPNLQFPF